MENNNSFENFSNNKNDNKPKKKFSFYWIYIILTAIFLGSIFFNGPKNAEEIDKGKLITLLRDRDVEKIDLVNGEIAEIYLNENGMHKYFPNDKSNKFNQIPSYTLRIGSVERFEQDLETAQEGFENAEWILIDYIDVVVHVFLEPKRGFYKLESLWADAERTSYED